MKYLKEDTEDGPPNLILLIFAIVVLVLVLCSCSTTSTLVQPNGCAFKKYKPIRNYSHIIRN